MHSIIYKCLCYFSNCLCCFSNCCCYFCNCCSSQSAYLWHNSALLMAHLCLSKSNFTEGEVILPTSYALIFSPRFNISAETKKEEINVSSFFRKSIRQPYICQYKFDFFSSFSSSAHKSTSWGLEWNSKSPGSWSMFIVGGVSGEPANIVAVAQ